MTPRMLVSRADLKRMADLANSENVTVEVEREGTIIRVMPYRPPVRQRLSREEQAEIELQKWLDNKAKTQAAR